MISSLGACPLPSKSIDLGESRGTFDLPVFVKTPDDQTITINVEFLDTVYNILTKIQQKSHSVCDVDRLMYGGKQMEEDKLVTDYNIQKYSTINVLINIEGGVTISPGVKKELKRRIQVFTEFRYLQNKYLQN